MGFPTCLSSPRGERDLCDLHTGHGSDAGTIILYLWKTCVTYILDKVATRKLQICLTEHLCDLYTGYGSEV